MCIRDSPKPIVDALGQDPPELGIALHYEHPSSALTAGLVGRRQPRGATADHQNITGEISHPTTVLVGRDKNCDPTPRLVTSKGEMPSSRARIAMTKGRCV